MSDSLNIHAQTQPDDKNPFLPGTNKQWSWDSTSLGWLKECPRKYQYQMILGYRSRGESVHLRFGQLYHSALEGYDKSRSLGLDHNAALVECVRGLLAATWDNGAPWQSEHSTKTRFTLLRSVIWYLEEFEHDAAKTVQLKDGSPAVELSFRFAVDNGLYLCGHLDRVVEYLGGTYVMDRKTASAGLTPYYFEKYNPDNQMSLYTLAGQVMYQAPIKGVVIDAAQILVGFTRFQRGVVYRTERQTEEWLGDFYAYVAQAHRYGEANYWPMNDKSCGNYGGCVFQKICSKDPAVREMFLASEFDRKEWNPLIPR